MPYEVSFTKRVAVVDREQYINECCVGGDVVVNQLLPSVRARYVDIQTNQEDWGWFIWFRKGHVRLAVDVFTDDSEQGLFRIHLTSRTKRLFLFDTVIDTFELEDPPELAGLRRDRFRCCSFTQTLRAEAVLTERQYLSLSKRSGLLK